MLFKVLGTLSYLLLGLYINVSPPNYIELSEILIVLFLSSYHVGLGLTMSGVSEHSGSTPCATRERVEHSRFRSMHNRR